MACARQKYLGPLDYTGGPDAPAAGSGMTALRASAISKPKAKTNHQTHTNMNRTRIYVASSWRNPKQSELVENLRALGFDVYDFKNPPGRSGFAWSEIDPKWKEWDTTAFIGALDHPLAQAGFGADMGALSNAHACVLLLPCGRSAHLELGYAVGAGKFTAVLMPSEGEEPELMYAMCDVVTDDLKQIYAAICKRFGRPPESANV